MKEIRTIPTHCLLVEIVCFGLQISDLPASAESSKNGVSLLNNPCCIPLSSAGACGVRILQKERVDSETFN